MSNSLDSHQAQHIVWADLGSKCLQRLAADAKINGYLTGVLCILFKEHLRNFPIGHFPVYVFANG